MSRNRQNGQALLVVLAVTALLVSVLAVTASNQRTALRATTNRVELRKLRLIGQAAVQQALQSIIEGTTNSTTSGSTSTTKTSVTLQDAWATLGTSGGDRFTLPDGSFRIQIVDASSLIDLNTASQATLQNLPLTQEQVDCLLDFRTAGTTPRADGAKDSYYDGLQNPYNAKLRNLSTFDELLQVKQFTPQTLYGYSNTQGNVTLQALTNGAQPTLADVATVNAFSQPTSATGAALINVNNPASAARIRTLRGLTNNTIVALTRNPPTNFPDIGAVLAIARTTAEKKVILDNLTASFQTRPEGLVNVNTASQNVLSVLPGITPDIASAIVSRQSSGFTSLGAITDVPGIAAALNRVAPLLTVTSQTYQIRILATTGDANGNPGFSQAYIATVEVANGNGKVVSFGEAPFNDMSTRWTWSDTTTSDIQLVAPTS